MIKVLQDLYIYIIRSHQQWAIFLRSISQTYWVPINKEAKMKFPTKKIENFPTNFFTTKTIQSK